ncbi:MAG: hypothetical protein ABIE94_04035 [archaeon]
MLKPNDIEVLTYLRSNARQPLVRISEQTGIPVTTLYDKLRRHERSFIKKYTSLIDFSKFGFPVTTFLMIRGMKEEEEKLKTYLKQHPNVNSVYKTEPFTSFMIEGIFKKVYDVVRFFEELEQNFKIYEKRELYVTEEVAREKFMTQQGPLVV